MTGRETFNNRRRRGVKQQRSRDENGQMRRKVIDQRRRVNDWRRRVAHCRRRKVDGRRRRSH